MKKVRFSPVGGRTVAEYRAQAVETAFHDTFIPNGRGKRKLRSLKGPARTRK